MGMMNKGGGDMGTVVLLAGLGFAVANGGSLEDGIKAINGYVDSGLTAIASGKAGDIQGVESVLGNHRKPPTTAFIGTRYDVEPDNQTADDKMREMYPDLYSGREG